MEESKKLALIVPAWKAGFLKESLQSLEKQSGNFHQVYIFDDAATPETGQIISEFRERNPGWKYHRFEENLGGKNLAAHWNRCIRMTEEDWIWLFSDDDVMEADCISAFQEELQRNPRHSVYRFHLKHIDEIGLELQSKSNSSPCISGAEFGRLRFLRSMDSSAVEFVFSRQAFEQCGGFPEFPAAWCADDAAWIQFSGEAGIRLVEGPSVFWRLSPASISCSGGTWTEKKRKAALQFIRWYNERFPMEAADANFRAEQIIWLRLQMVHQHFAPGFFQVLEMISELKIKGWTNRLRCFQDLYCLSYVYHRRVVLRQKPEGIRYWLSLLLPAY